MVAIKEQESIRFIRPATYSAPTEESDPEKDKSLDSDEILDDPATVDVLGEKQDVSHEPGKVTKEILEVSVTIAQFLSSDRV